MSNGLLNGLDQYYAPVSTGGGKVVDFLGGGPDGQNINAPVYSADVTAVEGETALCDPAAQSEISIAQDPDYLPVSEDRTYFMWVKLLALSNMADSFPSFLATLAGSWVGFAYNVDGGGATALSGYFSNPPSYDALWFTGDGAISLNVWSLLVTEWNVAAKTATTWVNNVQVAQITYTDDIPADPPDQTYFIGLDTEFALKFKFGAAGYYTELLGATRRAALLNGGAGVAFADFDSGGGAAPDAPTGLAATVAHASASLAWDAVSGATSYNVKRALESGGPYETIASPTDPEYLDEGLTDGTRYYYVVSAVNDDGESDDSDEVSAVPGNLTDAWAALLAGGGDASTKKRLRAFIEMVGEAPAGHGDDQSDRWADVLAGTGAGANAKAKLRHLVESLGDAPAAGTDDQASAWAALLTGETLSDVAKARVRAFVESLAGV